MSGDYIVALLWQIRIFAGSLHIKFGHIVNVQNFVWHVKNQFNFNAMENFLCTRLTLLLPVKFPPSRDC